MSRQLGTDQQPVKFKALAKQKGRLSMRGKGIRDQKQFEENWDKIFNKKK
tara:strand:+ start:425 stop:574 length:150 start_codon:yes stop_codon:yes gene_type:complete